MWEKLNIQDGSAGPLGAVVKKEGINFSLYSKHAEKVFLGLFSEKGFVREIPLKRSGDIWHIFVQGLPLTGVFYAYRCEGVYDEKKGLFFVKDRWLVDPYAKRVKGDRGEIRKEDPFDWQGVRRPNIPLKDLIIYEMHTRGFTKHPSSKVKNPGTFLGIIEKIPYLQKLGINAVELMPIFDFREKSEKFRPGTKELLPNYWGYDPFHYFTPMHTYAVKDPIEEFKLLVRELHRNKIEIILDVVFNHTGEGEDKHFALTFRGIDNPSYYMIGTDGNYLDFTGCNHTVSPNQSPMQDLILDSLHYWIEEMHVDGFRFDLGSILARSPKGDLLKDPPILKKMKEDPVIQKVKLIAEPWDLSAHLQGSFPKWGSWSEWNRYFRDNIKRFIKGTEGQSPPFANAMSGSKAKFDRPVQAINYITCHDGFSLRDLVSYNQKHNEANGDQNKDGANDNESWNCGAEGETGDPKINALRERQMRNFFLALFLSQGIPMLLMGDEYGHTRKGNNNPYVQDNEISWFLWEIAQKNDKILNFVSQLIAFRKTLPLKDGFLTDKDIEWHGVIPGHPDWNPSSRFVAFTLKGKRPVYVAFNASLQKQKVQLPPNKWHLAVNTNESWEKNSLAAPNKGPVLPKEIEMEAYSSVIAVMN